MMNTIQKFRKKPDEVQAVQLNKDSVDEIKGWLNTNLVAVGWNIQNNDVDYIDVKTMSGSFRAINSDYIVQDTIGGFYPCKPIIFNTKYEAA